MLAAASRAALIVLALGAAASGTAAWAGGVLERVRHDGVLHCGAEPRSGVAEDRGDGALGGVAVDLCRRVAEAALGAGAKITFRLYRAGGDEAALPDRGEELSFLTQQSIVEQPAAEQPAAGQPAAEQPAGGGIVRGPVVFTVRLSLLVARASPARRPQDLAAWPICFMIGSDAQQALDAAFRGWGLDFLHMGFEEEAEMEDAYAVRRCAAMAGEATELARLADGAGVNHLDSRMLPQALASITLRAVTPGAHTAWAAYVCGVLTRRAGGC